MKIITAYKVTTVGGDGQSGSLKNQIFCVSIISLVNNDF